MICIKSCFPCCQDDVTTKCETLAFYRRLSLFIHLFKVRLFHSELIYLSLDFRIPNLFQRND